MNDRNDETVVARCADCAYVHELEPTAHGPRLVGVGEPRPLQCRYMPKQMTIATGMDSSGQVGLIAGASYPPTTADEWCGQFEPAPPAEVGE